MLTEMLVTCKPFKGGGKHLHKSARVGCREGVRIKITLNLYCSIYYVLGNIEFQRCRGYYLGVRARVRFFLKKIFLTDEKRHLSTKRPCYTWHSAAKNAQFV